MINKICPYCKSLIKDGYCINTTGCGAYKVDTSTREDYDRPRKRRKRKR